MNQEQNDIRMRIDEYLKIKYDKRFSLKDRVNANLKLLFYQRKLAESISPQPKGL
jgi:hypothetical protein